jgi:predicted metalloprotease with PDZ domain
MGSGGGFSLNKKVIEKSISSVDKYSVGTSSKGFLGSNPIDTTFYFTASKCKVGDLDLNQNIEVKYRGLKPPTIGMDIWKGYNIILDWTKKEIALSKIDNAKFQEKHNFGFKIGIEKSDVVVNEIYHNSEAENRGLHLGDIVLQINDIDFQNNKATVCDNLKLFEKLDSKVLSIKVETNGAVRTITVDQN